MQGPRRWSASIADNQVMQDYGNGQPLNGGKTTVFYDFDEINSIGHMLADCPGAIEKGGQVEAPNAGQCYKCGSLEHTSR